MSLKGLSAVVTGSTSGIGQGIADVLASKGANLVINGFGDAAAIEAQRADLEARYGVKAVYSGADISRPDEVKGMIDLCVSSFGAVDILVNNAGIQYTESVEDFPLERWNAIIAINLSGVFFGAQAALPHMKKKGFGRIINIGSVHGLVGSTRKVAYIAAKHGVVGMSKVIALETAGSGVTCNTICPGWVHTPLVQKQIETIAANEKISIEAATEKLLIEKQPSKQFATPEQVGELAAFLSSEAAGQITGIAIPVDGGWTAQ
ncbi:3-hydroxybutyrate dehydrogenase [Phenylobacterium sp.]|uniref:3-hydroxybutyrate dehydrogenase n=1 Tax=Phenylobacterium sp. TaxID=1871053 RepID=UPI0025E7DB20|nr:3-hydroxybutyrate dehydrogenase [Phenylobacterium sp.]MBX3484831.1 3-hydroxybutyrate dehydrogenase [Phenylobacterium sp.]MCW5760895.1 3-hydroxybutyrate dehydrogenase [Phenylobacterium sp.]